MKYFIAFILFHVFFIGQSQDCYIDLSFPSVVFKKHKVKEVKVSMVQDATKKELQATYNLHSNNVFYRGVQYSGQGFIEHECNCNPDSTVRTHVMNSVDQSGNKILISKETKEYTQKKFMLSYSKEEFMGNYIRHIRRYNPLDSTETYFEVIAFLGDDTAQQSINKQNSKEFLMIAREKRDGVRTEKKQHVTYENGKVVQFDEYENGKLIFTRKGNPDEDALIRERVDPESQNALPYSDLIYNDTVSITIHDIPSIYKIAFAKGNKEKNFIKVIHYYRPDKKEIYGIDYYHKSGLPLISHVLALKNFTVYEYTFYK